jgi:hypothetical protein
MRIFGALELDIRPGTPDNPDQYATTFQSYRVRTRLIPGSSYDWQKHRTI